MVGLTCAGKTTLALALADALGGPDAVSVVVCDSTKIYRGADVGTAKLTGEARRGYEFLMVDVVEPGVRYSAGRYMTEGRAACEEIWRRGKLPLIVGGSGLYFRALIDGICEAPPADAEVRASLLARRAAGENLYQYLAGVPLSKIQSQGTRPLEVDRITAVALDAPRRWLAARVESRARRMFAQDLVAETRDLRAKVGKETDPPLNAIGYRQAVQLLKGELEAGAVLEGVIRETLRLAKKQRTWFKREKKAARLDATAGTDNLKEHVLALREERLQINTFYDRMWHI